MTDQDNPLNIGPWGQTGQDRDPPDDPPDPPRGRLLPPSRILLLLILAMVVALVIGVFSLARSINYYEQLAAVREEVNTAVSAQFAQALAARLAALAPQTEAPQPDPPETASAAAEPAPEVEAPAASPPEMPASVPVVADPQPARQGAPATAEEVASLIGGSPSQWSKQDEYGRRVGDNGWIYRGQTALSFTVPAGCVVDTPDGRYSAGAEISATDLTIYWI